MRLFLASSTCCEERMALRSFLTFPTMEERDEVLVLALGLDLWEVDVVFVVFSVALAVAMSAALVDEADDATVSSVVSAFLLVPSSSKDDDGCGPTRFEEVFLAVYIAKSHAAVHHLVVGGIDMSQTAYVACEFLLGLHWQMLFADSLHGSQQSGQTD